MFKKRHLLRQNVKLKVTITIAKSDSINSFEYLMKQVPDAIHLERNLMKMIICRKILTELILICFGYQIYFFIQIRHLYSDYYLPSRLRESLRHVEQSISFQAIITNVFRSSAK